MSTELQIIQSIDLFKVLTPEDQEEVAELLTPMRVNEGEILTRRGDPAHTLYVVLSGNFMIYFKDGRAFTLHDNGDVIGMATVITPFRYRGTTVALTDGEVLFMPGDKFLDLLQSNSSLSEKLMHPLSDVIADRTPFFEAAEKKHKATAAAEDE